MRVQLAQQAQEILGQSDLVIITERVDDVALLIGQMVKMGLPEVLDRHIPRHWRQRRISWGWTAVIWCDATTVSGQHEVTAGGLLQFGHSKDDPTRPQIKVMMGSLDPLGMPLATDVLSGERADDGLYLPIIERIRHGFQRPGLLFVGDCKMSAFDTRAYLAKHQDWYLSPLPLTGTTAEAMDAWITTGVKKSEAGELERIWRTNDRGHEVLAAEGYEIARTCGAPDGDVEWSERVLVVRSPMHATQQAAGLEKRLHYAETQLTALTPPRGRGKRQITDEATLVEAIAHVLTQTPPRPPLRQ